jgi:hypothetical protein
MLCFCLSLIQPLASSLLTCERGHGLDTSGTHLACCLFGGQQITTHDAIWDITYAFAWKSGHIVWKERWHTLMLRISLRANLYMTRKDQVFIANVVVIDLTWEMMVSSVISRPTSVAKNLVPLLRSASIEGFMKGTTLFQWSWKCTMHPCVIWIVSLGSAPIFSMIDNWEIIYPCFF